MPDHLLLERIREICLALPDTKETLTWGYPHFRVNDKIFTGYGEEQGKASIGFKLEMDHADLRVQDPRFWRAPYVGHKGWVSMDPTTITDWNEVAAMIHESYRLVASKKSLAKLAEMGGPPPLAAPPPAPPAAVKKPAKRAAAPRRS